MDEAWAGAVGTAWSPILDRGYDWHQRRLDLVRRYTRALEPVGHVREKRVDVDDIARCDTEDRLRRGIVVAVGDCLRRRFKAMRAGRERLTANRRSET